MIALLLTIVRRLEYRQSVFFVCLGHCIIRDIHPAQPVNDCGHHQKCSACPRTCLQARTQSLHESTHRGHQTLLQEVRSTGHWSNKLRLQQLLSVKKHRRDWQRTRTPLDAHTALPRLPLEGEAPPQTGRGCNKRSTAPCITGYSCAHPSGGFKASFPPAVAAQAALKFSSCSDKVARDGPMVLRVVARRPGRKLWAGRTPCCCPHGHSPFPRAITRRAYVLHNQCTLSAGGRTCQHAKHAAWTSRCVPACVCSVRRLL